MTEQLIALAIFVAMFALGAIRGIPIGVLMLAGAAGTALLLTDIPLDDVIAGFPLSIMVLLAGVTLFFAIAQINGTIDKLIDRALAKVGSNALLLPLVFFVITAAIASMGAPLAGLVMMPVGMQVARRYGVDFALMGLAMCFAIGAGGFAPTSLYGIVTYSTAHGAGIELNPFLLFGIAVGVYALMLVFSYAVWGRRRTPITAEAGVAAAVSRGSASTSSIEFGEGDDDDARFSEQRDEPAEGGAGFSRVEPFTPVQWATVAAIIVLLASVVIIAATGGDPDIGLLCFALSGLLLLIDPSQGRAAVAKIDWSTVLLVGGIITFVGLLEEMGAVELLGDAAKSVGSPLIAAFVLCLVGGLVSAFASTTGILAALVPLALPLIADGSLPGWALIAALGVCSAVVDVSPFSTLGATVVATAPEEEKSRLTRLLVRFGLSMVIVGPVVLVGGLVLPAMLAG
ncbi:SLC13 family permease [Brevibacterium album]|uniref:SLC13 family permease n=1 Tax=Brevibacterium album TaxID=417948 RepID=UPI000421C091|nr:SLC13 family permease [Brevibacterium album]